jgi:hypothetical protein
MIAMKPVHQETEYEIRSIDIFGDAIDVDHYQTKSEALEQSKTFELTGEREVKAIVVEKHTRYYPFGRKPDDYTVLFTRGDEAALKAGSWDKDGGPN